jgi:hypothetical protein
MNTTSLPNSELKHRPGPSDVINNLVDMFCDPECPDKYRNPALELGLIFMLDTTAETDLRRTLFGDCLPDTAIRPGLEQFMDTLTSAGVIEKRDATGDSHHFLLRFDAQPLVDILKAMPHRDPSSGLVRTLLTDCTIESQTASALIQVEPTQKYQ